MASAAEMLQLSGFLRLTVYGFLGLLVSILINACRQLFLRNKTEPPTVFHWIPYIGNAVSYGMDPVAFFKRYREKVSSFAANMNDSINCV